MFNGLIQNILMAFSMKTSRTCADMLPSENDDFKFLKTTKNKKNTHITYTIVPGLIDLFYLLNVSKGAKIGNRCNQVPHLTQDTNWKVT